MQLKGKLSGFRLMYFQLAVEEIAGEWREVCVNENRSNSFGSPSGGEKKTFRNGKKLIGAPAKFIPG